LVTRVGSTRNRGVRNRKRLRRQTSKVLAQKRGNLVVAAWSKEKQTETNDIRTQG